MTSSESLHKYRELVDGLVARRDGVLARWIREKGWPRLPENEKINAFLSKLTPDEREMVAQIARQARDGGIHDTLVYFQEEMDLRNLRLVIDGAPLPVSPYGTEIFWDWSARASGSDWPSPPTDEER
jgi:hypothetical protein